MDKDLGDTITDMGARIRRSVSENMEDRKSGVSIDASEMDWTFDDRSTHRSSALVLFSSDIPDTSIHLGVLTHVQAMLPRDFLRSYRPIFGYS